MEKKIICEIIVGVTVLLAAITCLGLYAMSLWAEDEELAIERCIKETGHTYTECESAVVW